MTQEQLETMHGDSGTILPEGLVRPDHWPEIEGIDQPSSETSEPHHPPALNPLPEKPSLQTRPAGVSTKIRTRLVRSNGAALELSASALIAQIDEEYERLRSNNFLADQQPEYRASAMEFLETIRGNISAFAATVPDLAEAEPESAEEAEAAKETQTAYEKFIDGVAEGCAEHFDTKRVGKSLVPVSIILGCGAIGAMVTGGNPLGFGVGMLAGKIFTGELKGGKAADALRGSFEDQDAN